MSVNRMRKFLHRWANRIFNRFQPANKKRVSHLQRKLFAGVHLFAGNVEAYFPELPNFRFKNTELRRNGYSKQEQGELPTTFPAGSGELVRARKEKQGKRIGRAPVFSVDFFSFFFLIKISFRRFDNFASGLKLVVPLHDDRVFHHRFIGPFCRFDC